MLKYTRVYGVLVLYCSVTDWWGQGKGWWVSKGRCIRSLCILATSWLGRCSSIEELLRCKYLGIGWGWGWGVGRYSQIRKMWYEVDTSVVIWAHPQRTPRATALALALYVCTQRAEEVAHNVAHRYSQSAEWYAHIHNMITCIHMLQRTKGESISIYHGYFLCSPYMGVWANPYEFISYSNPNGECMR